MKRLIPFIAIIVACSPSSKSAAEAESAYGVELANCTKNSKTLAESKACESLSPGPQ